MTREEAIYCMKSYINDDSYEHCVSCPYYAKNNLDSNICVCESRTAHEMAIKALEQDTVPFDFELYEDGLMDMPKGMIEMLDKIKAEIKDWYWQADKQALAKDPCVVDAMIDLFIRTIDKYKAEKE